MPFPQAPHIGQNIKMKSLQEQDFASTDRLEDLLGDLLAALKKLDLSIDYLSSAVTGEDPFSIGLSQTGLGRAIGRAPQGGLKENKKMKITKLQLKNIIQEVLDEVEFHGETPAGQLYGTEEEDSRFSMQLAAEKVMKRAGLDQEEMNYTFKAMEGDTVEANEFWDSSAHQKLYDFLDIPYEIDSQSMGAEMTPDKWILNHLGAQSMSQRAGLAAEQKNRKITKKELQKIVQEEFKAVLKSQH